MDGQYVKIFLVDDAYTELEDALVDKEKTIRSEVTKAITELCKSAKLSKVKKTLVINIKEENEITGERALKQDTMSFREFDIDKFPVKHDPDWIPEKMDKEEVRIYKQKVGDRTWKFLLFFWKVYCNRLDQYNKSLLDTEKKEKAEFPVCFEQMIHEQLIGVLDKIISKNIEKVFEEEFREIEEAEEKDKSKDEDKPKLAGSREKTE